MATIDEVVVSMSRSNLLDLRRLADWETDGGRVRHTSPGRSDNTDLEGLTTDPDERSS
jgi:hypothetical protein